MTTDNFTDFDDLFDHISDPDFNMILEDHIDKMPHTRESALKLMDVVAGFDIRTVYRVLLTDFNEVLTPYEVLKLQTNYKKIFDIPLID